MRSGSIKPLNRSNDIKLIFIWTGLSMFTYKRAKVIMFSCQLHVCVFGLFKCPTKSPWLGVRHSCQLSGGIHASGDTALKAYRQSKASALESTAIPITISSFPIPKKRKTRWMWHLDLLMRENGLILNRV